MNVGDIMSQEVISVTPETTVSDAAKIMLAEHISGLPVIDADNELVGIVTEGDFLRRPETGTERYRPRWLEFLMSPTRLAKEYVHTHGRRVMEVMTRNVEVATENMPLGQAVTVMESRRVKRLPVVRDGRVVGIMARANLLHALAASPPTPSTATSNKVIREKLETELAKCSWRAYGSISS
jgi:CBS domain-containing protein